MQIYILTTEYNLYDQYGAYFLKAFQFKPQRHELQPFVEECYSYHETREEAYKGLLEWGGGRMGTEDQWLNLDPVEI